MLIKICNIIIGYIIIAIITDLYLIDRHLSILDGMENRHEEHKSELLIVIFWPIFWVGVILGYFTK